MANVYAKAALTSPARKSRSPHLSEQGGVRSDPSTLSMTLGTAGLPRCLPRAVAGRLVATRPLLRSEADAAPPADVRAEDAPVKPFPVIMLCLCTSTSPAGTVPYQAHPSIFPGKSSIDVIGARGEMTAEVAPLKPAAHEPRRAGGSVP